MLEQLINCWTFPLNWIWTALHWHDSTSRRSRMWTRSLHLWENYQMLRLKYFWTIMSSAKPIGIKCGRCLASCSMSTTLAPPPLRLLVNLECVAKLFALLLSTELSRHRPKYVGWNLWRQLSAQQNRWKRLTDTIGSEVQWKTWWFHDQFYHTNWDSAEES